MELWDGLVCVIFIDGNQIGVVLDCNGLCLVCYWVIDDGFVVFVFELGVFDLLDVYVVEKG